MKPTRIFLDLDDVLADFTMPALAEIGCPVDPEDLSQYPIEYGFDIVKAANKLLSDEYNESEEFSDPLHFWAELQYKFWINLSKSKEADWLIAVCEFLVGRNNIYILTAPIFPEEDVVSVKVEWMYKFLPSWLADQYLIGKHKHLCASPETLLIDDSDKNVNDFVNCGGAAILWPRPWNSLYNIYDAPHTHIINRLGFFFGPLHWMPHKMLA